MGSMEETVTKQIALEIVAYCQNNHGRTALCLDYVLDEINAHFIFNPEGRHKK
jgi:hypothetical protein